MSKIFAMSDSHGRGDLIEQSIQRIGFPTSPDDVLVLCGDYIEHSWESAIEDMAEILDIQCRYPNGQVVVLAGNHEIDWAVNYGQTDYGRAFGRWISSLPLLYETEDQIFVHAGIDELAGDWWKTGTPDEWFTHKFPPDTGSWDDGSGNERSKDIVAGHVSVMNGDYLGGRSHGPRVYFDGDNHFYLDGTTEQTGVIPVLEYDTDTKTYYAWDGDGTRYPINQR